MKLLRRAIGWCQIVTHDRRQEASILRAYERSADNGSMVVARRAASLLFDSAQSSFEYGLSSTGAARLAGPVEEGRGIGDFEQSPAAYRLRSSRAGSIVTF
ncbi:MAG: hypothetical protein WBC51_07535 [Vicinamibacterales bacterium]